MPKELLFVEKMLKVRNHPLCPSLYNFYTNPLHIKDTRQKFYIQEVHEQETCQAKGNFKD